MRYSKQTIDTYHQLSDMGFGFKELKHLYNNLIEISLANNIKVTEIVSKFLKDVEKQFDYKLGFESKIKQIKEEMQRLENEVPEYKYYLQLQGLVSPILIHLANIGVTNEDIIGINNLVLAFKNSDFLSVSSGQNDNRNIHSNYNANNKSEYWNLFVEKLKSFRDIYLEIDKGLSNLNDL